jgi:transcriptional regulator of acetoin/glycerol metabolism
VTLRAGPVAAPPGQLFFSTPAQRAALARERFFEQGENASGLVNDAVLQSWSRCNAAGKRTRDRIAAEPISSLRLQTALRHSRLLRTAAAPGLSRLEAALAGTASQVLLTNVEGVIVCVGRRAGRAEESALPALARLGIDLSEDTLGTTAPGIVSATGKGCAVLANEHFNDAILQVHCAAAPIHDMDGRLAGVLDLSVEGHGFGFDAFTLIASYACDIENALLQLQSDELLVLAFHAEPSLLGTPLTGLAGIDGQGLLRWVNGTGARLSGGRRGDGVEDVFGGSLQALLGLLRRRGPQALRLPNGLTLWCEARLRAPDGEAVPVHAMHWRGDAPTDVLAHGTAGPADAADAADATATPTAPSPVRTLNEVQADNIAHALDAARGNVARAARALGVSRGVIYRHLQRQSTTIAGEPPSSANG